MPAAARHTDAQLDQIVDTIRDAVTHVVAACGHPERQAQDATDAMIERGVYTRVVTSWPAS